MQMSFASSSGGQNVNTAMTIDIPEYGPQQPPTVPPDSQVTDASAFLSAAAAAGAGSTTTTPEAPPEPVDRRHRQRQLRSTVCQELWYRASRMLPAVARQNTYWL